MTLASMSFHGLSRRPIRTLLTVLGVAAGIGDFVALNGLSGGIDKGWVNAVLSRGTHIMAFKKGATQPIGGNCEQSLAEGFNRIAEIRAVSAELMCLLRVEDETSGQMLDIVCAGWPPDSFLWDNLKASETEAMRRPAPPYPIMLGASWAESLKKKPGDFLNVHDYPCLVAGIVTAEGLANRKMGFMLLQHLQQIAFEEGRVSVFNLRVAEPQHESAMEAVLAKLSREFPQLDFIKSEQIAQNNFSLRFFRTFAWAASAIGVFIALVVVANTLVTTVVERTHEIGVLSALGWSPWRIQCLILMEGLWLSVLGGIAGCAVGIGILSFIGLLPLAVAVEWNLDMVVVLQTLILALGIGLAGSLYPSFHAARLEPVHAMAQSI